ncbi:unnamed protein product [Effrenium voratum]|uniref:Uncharacterized protein n=1 Tax=Effrenium voratum TaxID=2562239 RepID=A0AA36HTZ9_9DINO|nr:unnamed protein product [Effrenium voratum]
MAEAGVAGCILEARHLGPFGRASAETDLCRCAGWWTCEYCSFGFHVSQGAWMRDWDAGLRAAADAARTAAARPWVARILELLLSGARPPFAVSDLAMVRLLDIAILTGNKEAAVCCAGCAKLRPLRRWRSEDLFDQAEMGAPVGALLEPHILIAALSAGAALQLHVNCFLGRGFWDTEALPLREAVALATTMPWSDFAGVFEGKSKWVPRLPNRWVKMFAEASSRGACMSHSLLQRAAIAGLPLKHFNVSSSGYCWNLLQAAVLCGQPDCAELCAAQGMEPLEEDLCSFMCTFRHMYHQRDPWAWLSWGPENDRIFPFCVAPEDEQRSAAAAAARAAVIWSRKREVTAKGVALLQAMAKLLRASLPVLVEKVIDFLVEVPKVSLADVPRDVRHWAGGYDSEDDYFEDFLDEDSLASFNVFF